MTQGIFHITVATLIGTMAVFATVIATAPSRGGEAAKPAPAVSPVAAAIPAAPVAPPQPTANPIQPLAQPPTAARSLSWMDECVLTAAGQILTATQFSRPLSPGEVRRITHQCAAESIWREK